MDWESNDFDWMSPESGGDYSADENGFDFGNGGNNVNWDFGSSPDTSWMDFQNTNQTFGNNDPWDPMSFSGQGFQTPAPQDWTQNIQQQPQMGGTQEVLAKIFSNPTLLSKGIGALFEGSQNKKAARNYESIANRPIFDPFGSQRPFYQQQLQQAVTNPYDSPIVKSQVENLQRMQNIKDAAAGRRSNQLSSAPGVLAAQAEIAQKYMNSLMAPAGANINPNGSAIANALMAGAKADTNGYISPLLSVLGNATRTNDNQEALDQITKLLSRG